MNSIDLSTHIHDPARLAALQSVALLDTSTEEAFDRLSRLAARLLNAPAALVTLVDADRQFFKSCIGLLPEPWSSHRETPLSHSFCQHNRIAGQPLIIEDARTHPLVESNLAIRDLDVVAYLGFPLTTDDGYVLGSFCVIDSKPRQWAEVDVDIIRDLAASVMAEIQLRTEVATRHQIEGERDILTELNTQLTGEIAARKQAEKQQRELEAQLFQTHKIEAIGQLAGGVAHDLNNLLTPILIYTSMLLKAAELNGKHWEMIDQIQDAGLRARDLLRQLLAFSRKQAMQFKVLNLNEIIGELEKLLRRTIPADIQMNMLLASDVMPIMGDVNQIEQILMNLVVNAADAMPDGGELSIETSMAELDEAETSTAQDAAPGTFVLITIRDTGQGMDEETQEHLFEPFFTTKGAEGTGLGLATVMGIVLQHGGIVHCSSKLGNGTTFKVYLPITNERAVEESGDEEMFNNVKGAETVLLAEDDEQVRQLTHRVLQESGYMVFAAKDGDDALAMLSLYKGTIHLLLTDVVMPGMNGRTLFQKAIEKRPSLKVLYMSGHSEDIISYRGVLDTRINFISKPFLEDELLAKIQEVLTVPA